MPRSAARPAELAAGPFTIEAALRAGLTREQLRSQPWLRVLPRTYSRRGAGVDPLQLLRSARELLPPEAVFSGSTAAWLHAISEEFSGRIDITLPPKSTVSARVGLGVHRAKLPAREIVVLQGLRATSVPRTLADLARRAPESEAVIAADSALHSGVISIQDLIAYAATHRGAHGIARFRKVLDLADPGSESPMETLLRLLLVRSGLPRPQSQVNLYDDAGSLLGRADLYYAQARLVIEYDGSVHRDTLEYDDRRQNQLLAAGYQLLRFTSADVFGRPHVTVATVRSALRPNGFSRKTG